MPDATTDWVQISYRIEEIKQLEKNRYLIFFRTKEQLKTELG